MTILGIFTATILSVASLNGNPSTQEIATKRFSSYEECMDAGRTIIVRGAQAALQENAGVVSWVCTDGVRSSGMYWTKDRGSA